MLGAIIGDIVGSRFERHNHKSKDFELFTDQCGFTDDTAMTVAIAKALLECNGDYTDLSNHAIWCMQEIGQKYPNAGYGQIFYLWLHHKNPGPYRSYSNAGQSRSSRGDKRRGGCGFGYLGCTEWRDKKHDPKANRRSILYSGLRNRRDPPKVPL